jgi:hypothetical protein
MSKTLSVTLNTANLSDTFTLGGFLRGVLFGLQRRVLAGVPEKS